jgi:hypothetical protein
MSLILLPPRIGGGAISGRQHVAKSPVGNRGTELTDSRAGLCYADSLPDNESVGKNEVFLRFVTSFLTRPHDVSDFLEVAGATSVPEVGAVDRDLAGS